MLSEVFHNSHSKHFKILYSKFLGVGFFQLFGFVLFLIRVTIMKGNEKIYTGESDEGQLGNHKLNQYMKLAVEGLGFKNTLENI